MAKWIWSRGKVDWPGKKQREVSCGSLCRAYAWAHDLLRRASIRVQGKAMQNWDTLKNVLLIALGIYGILKARGIVPRNPEDAKKSAQWRHKFGDMMMIVGPMAIIWGVLLLLGAF